MRAPGALNTACTIAGAFISVLISAFGTRMCAFGVSSTSVLI